MTSLTQDRGAREDYQLKERLLLLRGEAEGVLTQG